MIFIILRKFKEKPTKESLDKILKWNEKEKKEEGVKSLGYYWTLGRYDAVGIIEAPDEKTAMRIAIRRADIIECETLVAVPAEEARKWLE